MYELKNHFGQVIKSKVNVSRLKLYTCRDFVVEANDDGAVREGMGKDDGRKEVEEASSTSFLPSGFGVT